MDDAVASRAHPARGVDGGVGVGCAREARDVLVVLCGVPGSGKTTLARAVCAMIDAGEAVMPSKMSCVSSFEAHHVSVDAHERALRDAAGARPEDAFDAEAWKSARARARARAAELLCDEDDGDEEEDGGDGGGGGASTSRRRRRVRRVVFADDNNYYASMRWEWFQIARERGAACVCAYVVAGDDENGHIPTGGVDIARERNARRASDRVPDEAFSRARRTFEAPSTRSRLDDESSLSLWSFPTVRIDTHACDYDVAVAWASIVAAWGAAPKKLRTAEELESAREETRRNAAHAVDVRSRKAVSLAIARADASSRARVAAIVNDARRELVARVRKAKSADELEALERAFYARVDA
uniref:ATPase AAA-type core domain-containing protein n=1 Tax=Ostreococcus mediterraneus TaxID=1486918 RepID=A0A7S0PQR6_9CHLO